MNESKLKHLELIQAVITRMANNSFFIKGWSVTIVAAILTLSNKDSDKKFIVIVIFPVIMFWILDAYFLYREKLFRHLYDYTRTKNNADIDFNMHVERYKDVAGSIVSVFLTPSLLLFYGIMLLATLVAILILKLY